MNLKDSGYRVHFACLKPRDFSRYCQYDTEFIHHFPMKSRFDLSMMPRLISIIKESGCRIIHSHTPRSLLLGALASGFSRVPLVHQVHSPTDSCTENRRRNRINAGIERLAMRRAAKVIAVSDNVDTYLEKSGLVPERRILIPNGTAVSPSLPDRLTPGPVWRLGAISLFRPRKGLEVLLDALALLKEEDRSFSFTAVGDFETDAYKATIMARVGELKLGNRVTWTGFCRDIPGRLADLDVLILPSLYGEGTPMVVLEAMAAGVPVVAADVQGMSAILRDKQDGLLFNPGDSAALAVRVSALIDGEFDWRALRTSAWNRHVQFYSDKVMAGRVAGLYNEILQNA